MKVVYMGTPDFAVPAADAILKAGHKVLAVFTQPDKAKGRSGKPVFPPVKEWAVSNGIDTYQPVRLRDQENVALIKKLAPDVIVVAAYGQILSKEILSIPKYGCVNIHASLLPKYRGAAPIARVIIDGEGKTGVTTMQMAEGLDTGDILETAKTVIEKTDDTESLEERLSRLGAGLILTTLNGLEKGTIVPQKQDDTKSTYAAKLTKEMGAMDFSKPAVELERLIRGLYPWPCAYTRISGKSVKIYAAEVSEKTGKPGEIIEVTKKSFTVACGEGSLVIRSLQPEGKGRMEAAAYLNGNKLTPGSFAGE